jgi:hypothetical protein
MSIRKLNAKEAVNTGMALPEGPQNPRLEAIAAFAALAKGYCDWCEQQRKGRNPRVAAAQWLSRLNEGIMNMPKATWKEQLPYPPNSWSLQARQTRSRIHLRTFNWQYRKVFDTAPDCTVEPFLGCVLEDLTGVYDDLSEGLALYDSGYPLSAQRHWQMMYILHWGLHATGALVAIYFKSPWGKR